MVGGRGQDSFNRASMAVRQPGSAFKPFVYVTALQKDMTPDTVMEDKPVTYGGWSPKNAEGGNMGSMTLRTALALSVNTIAVQLADEVGARNIISTAKKMGISTLVEKEVLMMTTLPLLSVASRVVSSLWKWPVLTGPLPIRAYT